jgi:hypothetical protein
MAPIRDEAWRHVWARSWRDYPGINIIPEKPTTSALERLVLALCHIELRIAPSS